MLKQMVLSMGLGVAMLGGVDAANAGCVTFSSDCILPDYSYSMDFVGSDGTQVNATATANGNAAKVVQDVIGLGVRSGLFDNTNQIDIKGPDEILFITFNVPVVIKAITFGNVGCDDNFKLISGNDTLATGSLHVPGHLAELLDLGTTTLNFNLGPLTEIGFTVPGLNDGYKVQQICYETASAIPLPAAAWSGLSGLGMMGFFAARKRLRKTLDA